MKISKKANQYYIHNLSILKIVFTNLQLDHFVEKKNYMRKLHKESTVLSKGVVGYLILVIRKMDGISCMIPFFFI